MSILFTSEEVIDICNGKYYSMNLGQHIRKYQHFGDVICLCYYRNVEKSNYPLLETDSAKFVFVEKENTLKRLLKYENYNKKTIENIVSSKEVVAVISHVPSANGYKAIEMAKKYGKPYMTIVVGCAWDALWNYDWKGKLLAPKAYFIERKTIKSAPYALYVTKIFLQKRYPCKGITEYASNVAINRSDENQLKQMLERINGLPSRKEFKIATIGDVSVKYKGQQYVIKALAQLNLKGKGEIHYYLIGGGDQSFLRDVAKANGVSEYVHFLGGLDHDKIFDVLDNIDLYIQPSKQEGLPRSLIEAMSRALPAIGTRVAGIPELLSGDYLFTKGNVQEIVRMINKVRNTEALLKMSEENFQKAKEYTLDVINPRRNSFFDKFILDYKLKV